MEGVREKQAMARSSSETLRALAMHKTRSHTISKLKPKVRIIHIFAPKIIKTDVANFRELVQRLTGKPNQTNRSSRGLILPIKKETTSFSATKKMGLSAVRAAGFHVDNSMVVKGEEENVWGGSSGGGFLGDFAEFDGFMQELNQCSFMENMS